MSKTNLQKLYAMRAGIRTTISMFIESAEESKEQRNIVQFKLALEELETKTKTLNELNEKIMSATDAEHIEEEIVTTEKDSFRLKLQFMGLREFQRQIDANDSNVNRNAQNEHCGDGRFEEQTNPVVAAGTQNNVARMDAGADGSSSDGVGSVNCDDRSHTVIQQEEVNVQPCVGGSQNATGKVSHTSFTANYHRLPKLTLPNFDGDVQNWQTFWDSFESTVHQNYNLTDVQKFSYLKSQLEGEAARTIDGFALTHINYARAIDLLKERYGQRHKIVHATMQALLQLPAPSNNLHSLRKFYDDMETKIRALESLGKPQENYGDVLVPIVLDKLPGDIREHLARQHGDDDWLLSDLRRAIFKEINIKEAGASNMFRPEADLYGSASSLFAGAKRYTDDKNQGEKRQTLQCLLCADPHVVSECEKYPNVQSKLKVVKEKKLCFNCFRKHAVFSCKSRKRCQRCGRKHHTTICQTDNSRTSAPQQTTRYAHPQQTTRDAAVLYTSARQSRSGVLLKTAITDVCYRDSYSTAAVLFDEGAQRSFITETLANELQLPRESTEAISLSAFGGSREKVQHIDTSTVYVVTEQQRKIPVRVLIVPTIATPIDISHRSDIAELTYLKGLKLAHPISDDNEFPLSLLIGADFYWDFIEDEVIRGCGPTAVKSKLGYLLSGSFNSVAPGRSTQQILNVMLSTIPDELSLERFWNLESLEITKNEPDCKLEQELQHYQETSIEHQNGRYTARLPWRSEHPELPTNYNIVLKRTESTVRRLAKEPEMLKKYGEIIAEQERRGFIEKVPDAELNRVNQIHYIPHHPVKKDSSTTPIRIVYDCSCRQTPDSPSLNDCLQSTPPVLNELTSILLRFRLHRYAVTTDIEKAFLNVSLHPDDRDVRRFLWLQDPSDPCSEFLTYRFRSVLFGATSSPFILNATILKHLETNPSVPASEILRRDLYVDNVISSFQEDDECDQYYREARALMSSAGMNLRSWSSNSEKLLRIAERDNVLDTDDVTKVLGLRWDPSKDVLSFAKRDIPVTDNVTKRFILKQSSQIYDPLGLLSPVTVRAKILMQDIWKQKFDWDVHLPENVQTVWNSLARDLNTATHITFQRQYLSKSTGIECSDSSSLHIFVDASLMSYGAAAYISNKEESQLIMAKNRVAPLKSLTLPKLELMAVLVGARLAEHLQTTFPTANITMWSDSQIVLHWIGSQKVLPRFVANRVKEIRDLTQQYKWKYCPTADNPADLQTRGITAENFIKNDLWITGPAWLCDKTRWPTWEFSENLHVQIMLEEPRCTQLVVTDYTDRTTADNNVQNVITVQKYSKLCKLLRITGYVYRFIHNCRLGRSNAILGPLTATELDQAELLWIRSCQATNYREEMHQLKTNKPRATLIKQLHLFLDDTGTIRCSGRIHNAAVDGVTKFPYLLPKKHTFTTLVVQAAHESQGHSGMNSTVTGIRQKFWIPAIRQCVNAIIRKCVICRKVQGNPYRSPEIPPLPKLRVTEAPPFTVTGVDFTGALYIRSPSGTENKAYVCLFTCAATRAIHLEVVTSMSTDCFLQAFRRFTSRKSLPSLMISDNAKTFQKASTYLKSMFESQTVRDHLANVGVDWRFIPERAPWYGGWWERLIGLTKQTLKKILGRALVDLETLQTVVIEVESILNDRPLTYVSSTLDDPEPLTPAHLMTGRKIRSLPYLRADIDHGTLLSDRNDISRRARIQSRLIDQFWTRWKTEYLTALRERNGKPGPNSQTIRVGEVVQVHEDSPRIRWKLAVIQSLVYGNDGLIRAAKIKMANGLIATRPIVKLYPLEVIDAFDKRDQ